MRSSRTEGGTERMAVAALVVAVAAIGTACAHAPGVRPSPAALSCPVDSFRVVREESIGPHEVCTRIDGVQHGPAVWRRHDGSLLHEATYREGVPDGVVTYYFEDGHKASEISYRRGVLDGAARFWYRSGGLLHQVVYRNGRADGATASWYETGIPRVHGSFVDGVLAGEWVDQAVSGAVVVHTRVSPAETAAALETRAMRSARHGDFVDAAADYRRAYELGGALDTLLRLGQTLWRNNDCGAEHVLRRYLAVGGDDPIAFDLLREIGAVCGGR
jgi:hypothetical protein